MEAGALVSATWNLSTKVHPGTLIWTDGHKSYDWLSSCPEFRHQHVVHSKGQFSKVDDSGVAFLVA